MVIKVGINGFGRIGRVVFRTCLENSEIQVCAINDPGISVVYISYLIKFDTTHGKFKGTVSHSKSQVFVDGRPIEVFQDKLPSEIPWDVAEIKYVIEASGMFTTFEKASGHLERGVTRVIVTAPSLDIPMLILGVNDKDINPDMKVISCASSTLYCLAPIVKILEDNFGLEEGFLTSIRAMTPSFKPIDGTCVRGKLWRNHRCIHQNITPAKTGVCKALAKIMPELKNKLAGIAFKIPVVNVSMLDLTVRLSENTSILDIIDKVELKGKTTMKNLIKTSRQVRDSADYIGESHSCIVDILSSIQLKPNCFKLICWYENDYSYAYRIIETIQNSEKEWQKQKVFSKMDAIRPLLPSKHQRSKDFKTRISARNNKADHHYKIHNTSNVTDLKKKWPIRPLTIKKTPSSLVTEKSSTELICGDTIKANERDADDKKTKDVCYDDIRMTNEVRINDDGDNVITAELKQDLHTQHRRRSSTHHCATDASDHKTQNDLIQSKTLIRLETVRKELSKMVHITEDLLRKSLSVKNNIQPVGNTVRKSTENMNKIDTESTSKMQIKTSYTLLEKYLNDSFDEGSTESVVKSKINKKSLEQIYTQQGQTDVFSEETQEIFTSAMSSDSRKSVKSVIFSIDDVSDCAHSNFSETKDLNIEDIKSHEHHVIQPKSIEYVLEKATESGNILIDDSNPESNKKSGSSIEPTDEIVVTDHQTSNDRTDQSESNLSQKDDCTTDYFPKNKQLYSCTINKTDDESDKSADIKTKTQNTGCFTNDNAVRDEDEEHKANVIDIESISDIDSQDELPCSTRNLKFSSNLSIISTISTKAFAEEKKDIYDKLESESVISGTDSCTSFEIKGKTSEVISISELTKSVEDFSEIDKICRIMEISDELSDRLFLPLSNQSNRSASTKSKWSLRNLCEKIKLDEFCDEVFGK